MNERTNVGRKEGRNEGRKEERNERTNEGRKEGTNEGRKEGRKEKFFDSEALIPHQNVNSFTTQQCFMSMT